MKIPELWDVLVKVQLRARGLAQGRRQRILCFLLLFPARFIILVVIVSYLPCVILRVFRKLNIKPNVSFRQRPLNASCDAVF